jgi:hypothetical protein
MRAARDGRSKGVRVLLTADAAVDLQNKVHFANFVRSMQAQNKRSKLFRKGVRR